MLAEVSLLNCCFIDCALPSWDDSNIVQSTVVFWRLKMVKLIET